MDENKIKIDLSVMDETNEQPKKNKQARDWCFTINNPVQSEQEFLAYLQTVSVWTRKRELALHTTNTASLSRTANART